MQTKTAVLVSIVLTLAAAGYTAAVYGRLPELVPTHWGISGQVDGWAPRATGVSIGLGFMALFTVLVVVLPWLSPRNFKVDNFRLAFNYIMAGTVGLMGFVQVVILQAGLNPKQEVGRVLVAGIALFLAFVGNLLGKVRRNFWIGIRTPWTLASDEVWFATHRLAARLMVACGLVCAVLVLCGGSMVVAFVLVMASALIPVAYSAYVSKKLEGRG